MVFTAAHHYKLPWLSFGDNLGCLDPQKVDTWHDLLIGQDFSYDLLQLLTFFVLSKLSTLLPTFKYPFRGLTEDVCSSPGNTSSTLLISPLFWNS